MLTFQSPLTDVGIQCPKITGHTGGGCAAWTHTPELKLVAQANFRFGTSPNAGRPLSAYEPCWQSFPEVWLMGDHPCRARSLGTGLQQPKRSLTRFGMARRRKRLRKKRLLGKAILPPTLLRVRLRSPAVMSLDSPQKSRWSVDLLARTACSRPRHLSWGLGVVLGRRGQEHRKNMTTDTGKHHQPNTAPIASASGMMVVLVRCDDAPLAARDYPYLSVSLACSFTPCRRQTKFMDWTHGRSNRRRQRYGKLTSFGRRNIGGWVIRRYLEILPMTKLPIRGGHEALRCGLDNSSCDSSKSPSMSQIITHHSFGHSWDVGPWALPQDWA